MTLDDIIASGGGGGSTAAPKKSGGLFGFLKNPLTAVALPAAIGGEIGGRVFGKAMSVVHAPSGVRSLPDQARSVASGFVPGLLASAQHEIGATVHHPLEHNPIGELRGVYRVAAALGSGQGAKGAFGQASQTLEHASPFVHGVGASMSRTGGRFVDLASVPLGKQTLAGSKYGKAGANGTIVPTLIEDAGNIALVGGLATKALSATATAAEAGGASSAGGLRTAANVADKITNRAHWVADAPARPLRLAAQGAREIGQAVAPELRGVLGRTEGGQALLDRMTQTAVDRAKRTTFRNEFGENMRREGAAKVQAPRLAAAKAEGNLRGVIDESLPRRAQQRQFKDLQHTAILEATGHGPLRNLFRQVPEEQRQTALNQTFGVRQKATPAVIEALGTGPAIQAMMAANPLWDLINKGQESRLAGTGGHMLHPGQLGDAPMPSKVAKLVASGVDPAALEAGPASVAPGRFVPALRHGEAFNAAMKNLGLNPRAPTTMAELPPGVLPRYVPGGVEEPYNGVSTGAKPTPVETTPGTARRKVAGDLPKSFKRVAQLEAVDAQLRNRNEWIQKIDAAHVRTVGDLVKEEIGKLEAKGPAMTDVERSNLIDLQDTLDGRGHDKAMLMKDLGKVSIDKVPSNKFTLDTKVIDSAIAKEYRAEIESGSRPKTPVGKVYAKATTGIKHALLGLNPMWSVNNAASNPMMTTARGGITPSQYLEARRIVQDLEKQEVATGTPYFPARLDDAGGAAEAARSMSEGKEPRNIVSKAMKKNYDWNQAVDNRNKRILYVALQKYHGFTPEEALQHSVRSVNDMSNLRPVEQQIKKALPFYPWARHSTQMVFDLTTKHPWRTAALLDVSQQGRGDPSNPANAYDPKNPLQNGIRIGHNWVIPTGGVDPFRSGVNTPLLSPSQAAQQLNPIIKMGASGLFDMNLGRSRMNTRPGGTTGKFKLPSLAEDFYTLSQQTPQTKAIGGLFRAPIARYDTGIPITSHNRLIMQDGSRAQQVLKPLGLPIPTFINADRQAKTTAGQAAKKRKAKK